MAGRRAIVEILAQRMVLNLNIDAAERLSLDLPTRWRRHGDATSNIAGVDAVELGVLVVGEVCL